MGAFIGDDVFSFTETYRNDFSVLFSKRNIQLDNLHTFIVIFCQKLRNILWAYFDYSNVRKNEWIEYTEVRNFAQGEEEWASHRDSATMDVA